MQKRPCVRKDYVISDAIYYMSHSFHERFVGQPPVFCQVGIIFGGIRYGPIRA